MAVERIPWMLDGLTGFPLPLMPLHDAPAVYNRDGTLYHSDPDFHHFFFPKRAYIIETGENSSTLVRVSRAQRVRRYYHKRAHDQLSPPEIIIDPSTSFYLATLALSNYVPSTAIDLRGHEPVERGLSLSEYQDLRESTQRGFRSKEFTDNKNGTTANSHEAIAGYLLRTMIRINEGVIDDDLRCQLLEAPHNKRRRDIANAIANLVTYHAVSPINPIITECKKTGEIPIDQPSPFKLITDITRTVDRATIVSDALAA